MIKGRCDYKVQELRVTKSTEKGVDCLGSIIYVYKYPECELDENLKMFDSFILNNLEKMGLLVTANPYYSEGLSEVEWMHNLSRIDFDIPLLPTLKEPKEGVCYPATYIKLYAPSSTNSVITLDRINYDEPVDTQDIKVLRDVISYWERHHLELHEVLPVVYFKGSILADGELKEFYRRHVLTLASRYPNLKDVVILLINEVSCLEIPSIAIDRAKAFDAQQVTVMGRPSYILINNTEKSCLLSQNVKENIIFSQLDIINDWVSNRQ